MKLEINSNIPSLSHAWRYARGFNPIDGVYYLVATFTQGNNDLDEIIVVLGVGGKYFHLDKAKFISLDTLLENDSHTVLIHPVPSLSTEVYEAQ